MPRHGYIPGAFSGAKPANTENPSSESSSYCTRCSKATPVGAKFCPECGGPI